MPDAEILARASKKEVEAAIKNVADAFGGAQEPAEKTFRRCAEAVGSTDHALEVLDVMFQVAFLKGSPNDQQFELIHSFRVSTGIDFDDSSTIMDCYMT